MATIYLAMWLQQDGNSGGARQTLFIFLAILVPALLIGMATIIGIVAGKTLKAIKELSATAEEVKTRLLPLLDEVTSISKTSRVMLEDAAPKIKLISENLVKTSDTLVETSRVAKSTVVQVQGTLTDANLRTQRQVARVDGMVSAALTTTQELADTISNGIRVPAMKIAEMIHQAKGMAEGLVAKVKGGSGAPPFGSRRRPE